MHYLTVQDILWINLQITKHSPAFDFASLEEATFYQFAYGSSKSVASQASRFLIGFARKAPFTNGNKATAFVGFMTFLELNSYSLPVPDSLADSIFEDFSEGKLSTLLVHDSADRHFHNPDVRGTIASVVRRYPETIQALES